eukprot:scaffold283545_cov27-Prasinocladus_malaysianus.AAC.1
MLKSRKSSRRVQASACNSASASFFTCHRPATCRGNADRPRIRQLITDGTRSSAQIARAHLQADQPGVAFDVQRFDPQPLGYLTQHLD